MKLFGSLSRKYGFLLVLLLSSISSQSLFAQDAEGPKLLLWSEGAPGAVGKEDSDSPCLFLYPAVGEKRTDAAVIVCPGGGYGGLAISYEGHDIARWFNSLGISAFVLRYRHAPKYHQPIPLEDAQRALRLVRSRADEWKIAPNKIGIMGFSAGGHLASSASTHFDKGNPQAKDPIDRLSCRPDFAILCYPVITMQDAFTHAGSKLNLLGENPSADLVKHYSSELQVTAETPPAFLFHTAEDKPVPAENSLLYFMALHKHGIPSEMHVYEKGRHGVGLGQNDPVLSTWPGRCIAWLAGRGIIK